MGFGDDTIGPSVRAHLVPCMATACRPSAGWAKDQVEHARFMCNERLWAHDDGGGCRVTDGLAWPGLVFSAVGRGDPDPASSSALLCLPVSSSFPPAGRVRFRAGPGRRSVQPSVQSCLFIRRTRQRAPLPRPLSPYDFCFSFLLPRFALWAPLLGRGCGGLQWRWLSSFEGPFRPLPQAG